MKIKQRLRKIGPDNFDENQSKLRTRLRNASALRSLEKEQQMF